MVINNQITTQMNITKAIREERNDVFSFSKTVKRLDENEQIIEVEETIKECTLLQLQDEKTALETQIAELQKQIVINEEMQTMINNFVE